MDPRVAEDLPQHLARAVDDAGLPGEALGRGDEARDLDHARDAVDAAGRIGRRCEPVERARACVRLGVLGGHLGADLAGRGERAVDEGQLAARVDEAAVHDGGDVGGDGGRDRGQLDAELGQPFGDRAHQAACSAPATGRFM